MPAAAPSDPAAAFDAWLRAASPELTWDWPHLVRVRQELARVERGEIDRLLLTMPPQHGKSELVSVRWPAYLLDQDPRRRIIVASYNQTLANRFSRRCRRLLEGRALFTAERKAVGEWELLAGGGLRAVGIGAGLTGHPGDIGIIDDPIKSREEANSPVYRNRVWDWYTNEFCTRLPHGPQVLMMTRWHGDDLAGRVQKHEPGRWTVLNLPALAEADDPLGRGPGEPLCPARASAAFLAHQQALMGADFFALYLGRPQPPSGTLFQREWFPRYGVAPTRDQFLWVVQSWDCAVKAKEMNSYSALSTWGVTRARKAYLLHAWHDHVELPELEEAAWSHAATWHPSLILIEDKGNGSALLQALRRGRDGRDGRAPRPALPVLPVEPEGNKVMRASAISPDCQGGLVFLPELAPWLEEWIDEHVTFPRAAYNDWVDATSQFLAWLREQAPAGTLGVNIIAGRKFASTPGGVRNSDVWGGY